MSARELLVELAGIAVLCVGWTVLVMLMLEKDRKRIERRARWTADRHTADSSGPEIPAPPQSKEPRGSAAAQEDNRCP